ncbi:MAG: hypothetical protein J6R80_00435 [Kiritimatiellae bacterium]|nr:hypothetical protein [Kiritimatiellia bacterium]
MSEEMIEEIVTEPSIETEPQEPPAPLVFEIGQKFVGIYPPEAAEWCNANNAFMYETTVEGATERTFEIGLPPQPSLENVKKMYEDAVQEHLDATAQSGGYTDSYTCLSYHKSTDEVWRTESAIFNAWRDAVWHKCHEILNTFMAGEIEQPTVDEVIAQLPEIDWNGGVA